MDPDFRSIVANPSVIAIDQDELTTPGDLLANTTDGGHIWSKPLFNGDQAVILYNPLDVHQLSIQVTWDMLGWSTQDQVTIYDLWNNNIIGNSCSIKPRQYCFSFKPCLFCFCLLSFLACCRSVVKSY